ncbi:unnamed protein product (macronuclear) [Paramecium tetraurelia]|uniref:Uncharacterized protein n=1 Tax=Paramecium tetraurelia TaxID=5888 RepID=A0C3E3_PARTE|nr:uncharacterized protein GSPATT00034789001 [Paramecium tetraurelia]CAK65310.1 unnamed protein product [Paramecium tetraurelia]|eukprot:XP_001432707.1 hypothetical protein (macronuclear) [Paramecium tetraurelia strain d4-2]
MHLEKHAKTLIYYYNSSDEDEEDYNKKALSYRNDFNDMDDQVLRLKQENLNNKQSITDLLEELEIHQQRVVLLQQSLMDQKKLAQDSQDQLRRIQVKKQEDKLLKEQKRFQDKFALQTNTSLEKLRQHFDFTLQQLTPKPNNR